MLKCIRTAVSIIVFARIATGPNPAEAQVQLFPNPLLGEGFSLNLDAWWK